MSDDKKVKLIELSKFFLVQQSEDDFNVSLDDLTAIVHPSNHSVEYYVNGVYNSGDDLAEINIDNLKKLQQFCNLMLTAE